MALIARIGPDPRSLAERLEMQRIVRAVRDNYPEVLLEMRPTAEQTARYRAKSWFSSLYSAGLAAPEPLSLQGPLVNECARTVARKLFTALHYKEFSKIVPRSGGVLWRWYSNAQRLDGAMPDELINLLQSRPTIQRTRRDLSDQFTYTYAKVEDGELTGYFATFRQAFALLGFVDLDADRLREGLLPQVEILHPLGVDPPRIDAA